MLVDPVGLLIVCGICALIIGFAVGWIGGAAEMGKRQGQFEEALRIANKAIHARGETKSQHTPPQDSPP